MKPSVWGGGGRSATKVSDGALDRQLRGSKVIREPRSPPSDPEDTSVIPWVAWG